ncbi:hypothetical protein MTO96_038144 [Rhipicephalus appendiculatus]
MNRIQESQFHTVMPLLISGDEEYFKKYYRMSAEKFEQLHALLEQHLTKLHAVRGPILSRARLAITIRFRILRRTINLLPKNADYIVMACCVLHNFLLDDAIYMSQCHDDIEQENRGCDGTALISLQPPVGHNYTRAAAATRDLYCDYFVSVHVAIPWQQKRAGVRP